MGSAHVWDPHARFVPAASFGLAFGRPPGENGSRDVEKLARERLFARVLRPEVGFRRGGWGGMPARTLLCLLAAQRAAAYVPWNEENDYRTDVYAGSVRGDADGTANVSLLYRPTALSINPGTSLFIADTGNHKIKVVDLATTVTSTLVGSVSGSANGIGAAAMLREPSGVAIDTHLNRLYVADTGNHVIRVVDVASRRMRTLAGADGVSGFVDARGRAAHFWRPHGLAINIYTRHLFVCDTYNHAVPRRPAPAHAPPTGTTRHSTPKQHPARPRRTHPRPTTQSLLARARPSPPRPRPDPPTAWQTRGLAHAGPADARSGEGGSHGRYIPLHTVASR